MAVTVLDPATTDLPVGGVWVLSVEVTDPDGCPVADTVAITVTDPAAATHLPAVEELTGTGRYRATYVMAAAGRHTARAVSTSYGSADLVAYAAAITTAADMPDLVALRGDPNDPDDFGYLGRNSATDAQIQDALDAETDAQRRACRVPAAYPADLRQALMRRVARNLAMRRIPLAVLQGDGDTGPTVPPARDAEVRRLEAPHRRLKVG